LPLDCGDGPSRVLRVYDLPPELFQVKHHLVQDDEGWLDGLRQWAEIRLKTGGSNVATEAIESAERILITTALHFTGGKRFEAAKLLGYGRNTLTRKIRELNMNL